MADKQTPGQTPANTPATDSKRGRKPGPAKEYNFAGLNPEMLAAPQEVTAQMASQFAPSRVRDANQIAMDEVIRKYPQTWIDCGSPTRWVDMPKCRYHVPPAAVDGFRYLVRRAADFHGVAIKWGGQQGTAIKDSGGNIVLVFAVRDRRERAEGVDDDLDTGEDTREDDTEQSEQPETGDAR
jgi:hypothetical protein